MCNAYNEKEEKLNNGRTRTDKLGKCYKVVKDNNADS